MAHNRVRDATHQRSSYSAEPPTAHHDQVRLELFGQGHDLKVHRPHPEVSPCHGGPGHLHPPGLFPEPLPGLLFYVLVELAIVAERPGRKLGTTPTCTTCNSESVLWASSTALKAASSASLDPSVASRILVAKMLIVTLSFPVGSHRGICADCINTLVQHKGTKTARRRSRRTTEAYAPECVEGVFSEVEHSPGPLRQGFLCRVSEA